MRKQMKKKRKGLIGRVRIYGIVEYGGEVVSLRDANELDRRGVFRELSSGDVIKEK